MSLKESQEKIVANMKNWQKIENSGMASTNKIMEKTDNPVVKLIMEIIQRDSAMHHRVQQFIVDSLEKEAITLTPDDLGTVWTMIEDHQRLERSTVEIAMNAIDATKKSKGLLVQNYLLEYLLKDEKKHEEILANLENIKKGMYPYG
jgi:hypothetical protein